MAWAGEETASAAATATEQPLSFKPVPSLSFIMVSPSDVCASFGFGMVWPCRSANIFFYPVGKIIIPEYSLHQFSVRKQHSRGQTAHFGAFQKGLVDPCR
jgi:hypothetical protein